MLLKLLTSIIAVTLIALGLVVFPMPIPLGAIMIVCGLVMLISVSASVALYLKMFRRRHNGANKIIQKVEDKLPKSWKKVLSRTDP